MDVAHEQSGGGTRRRRRGGGGGGGRRRKTARADAVEQEGGGNEMIVSKADDVAPSVTRAPAPAPVGRELAPIGQTGGGLKKAVAAPVVVIAPAKKRPAKVTFVPKAAAISKKPVVKKTFRARKVRVTIDNTAKTHKRRRHVLGKIDDMTDVQVREAAVRAKLSRAETVAKAPIGLLRQMVKDYYTMRGQFL